MSIRGIQILLGKAVISDEFRAGLLNGQRAQLVADPKIDIAPHEAAALLAIKADNLKDFGAQVNRLIEDGISDQADLEPGPTSFHLAGWPRLAASGSVARPH